MTSAEVVENVKSLAQAYAEALEREMRLVENLVIIAAELGVEANYDAVVERIKALRAFERAHTVQRECPGCGVCCMGLDGSTDMSKCTCGVSSGCPAS